MDEIDEWEIVFTKQAEKDARKIASSGLGKQVTKILDAIKEDPYSAKRCNEVQYKVKK
ncbi:hypothetical protein [Roseofilum sp. Guam]|uniref:type II toxin-antitoxin system RelE family toxin n=1 Tax=Roseofilum sp. Guam TaxID=2821502 RepID=UPI001B036768|nr:hypothetical protein [Roseofilum sp. Guam]MBP0027213.1 hypothetical protein [Roseofilum sp. Guam]